MAIPAKGVRSHKLPLRVSDPMCISLGNKQAPRHATGFLRTPKQLLHSEDSRLLSSIERYVYDRGTRLLEEPMTSSAQSHNGRIFDMV